MLSPNSEAPIYERHTKSSKHLNRGIAIVDLGISFCVTLFKSRGLSVTILLFFCRLNRGFRDRREVCIYTVWGEQERKALFGYGRDRS